MLESLRKLFSDLSGGESGRTFDEGDYRVAVAALLVHIVGIDGAVTEAERTRLHAILKSRFDLDEARTAALVDEATQAEGEAVDLYHFTRLINRSLDEEGKKRIIEMMWEMIYADHHVNEFEDNVVWRVADLLGVSSRERIGLRQQVEAAQTKVETTD
ncbi:MAG: TerB family tellurite resistance protein [Variibacter sp.]